MSLVRHNGDTAVDEAIWRKANEVYIARCARENTSPRCALDAIVADLDGRLYLAKDARGPAAMLAGYPELNAFRAVRERVDPTHRFSSLQSQRIGL